MKAEKTQEIVSEFARYLVSLEDNKNLMICLAKHAKNKYMDLFQTNDYHEKTLISKKYHNWRTKIRKRRKNETI